MNNFYEKYRAKFFLAVFHCLKSTNDLRLHIQYNVYGDQRGYYWYERAYLWLFGIVWGFFEYWMNLPSQRNKKRMRKALEKTERLVRKINRKWVLHMIEEKESKENAPDTAST